MREIFTKLIGKRCSNRYPFEFIPEEFERDHLFATRRPDLERISEYTEHSRFKISICTTKLEEHE